ncbi:MAG: hypothetical protein IT462_17000 [Planctomycetes bacterium]|nr:hypothetical protein [Planctomycetota bacterium]
MRAKQKRKNGKTPSNPQVAAAVAIIEDLPQNALVIAIAVLRALQAQHAGLPPGWDPNDVDDVPLNEEEEAALVRGRADIAAGRVSPWREVRKRLLAKE